MLSQDLTLNPSTAIAAGTNAATVYALLSATQGKSQRSVASVATTAPKVFQIAHSTRSAKAFKTAANASVPAPDIIFDRHLVRLDENVVQTTHIDPEFRVNRSVQLVLEVPRLGASTPTPTQIADSLKALVSMLDASTQANLIRILNNEV